MHNHSNLKFYSWGSLPHLQGATNLRCQLQDVSRKVRGSPILILKLCQRLPARCTVCSTHDSTLKGLQQTQK